MQFSDTSTKQGIIEDIDFWSASDSETYPTADKTRNVNRWLDRVVSLILRADSRWEWDDNNQTDMPIATASLVSGQQDYGINSTHLKVLKVRCKDSQGNWRTLEPIGKDDDRADRQQFETETGDPVAYDKVGNSFLLTPIPNYASSGGFKVYFQRSPSYFVAGDTTKTPGFADPFHRILSLGASLDWALVNAPERVTTLERKINDMENELIKFYTQRARDERPRMRLQSEDYSVGEDGGGHPYRFDV